MFAHKLLFACLVLCLILGAQNKAWSANNPTVGQDESNIVTGSESKAEEPISQNNNQSFPSLQQSEEKFLLLDPDCKTPADYQRLLAPDQLGTSPER